MKDCTILGLDISTANTGWSVAEYNGKATMKAYGDISRGKGKKQLTMQELMLKFEANLVSIIETYKPDYISVEAPFASRNIDTLQKLSWLHGIMQLIAVKNNIPVTYYSVMTLKSKTLGKVTTKKENGEKKTAKDLKMEVQEKVKSIFNITDVINDDISDSMSAIVTFINMDGQELEKKTKKKKKTAEDCLADVRNFNGNFDDL